MKRREFIEQTNLVGAGAALSGSRAIDRLAKNGVRFTNAYTPAPFAHRHGRAFNPDFWSITIK